ncbi:hypothetical protein HQN87_16370 [Paenibacillus tritici]|uniref:Uncharacterized protein n=1 Tax=Paenibacillus tritici TaxID=1873425 RepID=A0ABX2DQI6_9BACL|nr:DUF6809 family protein [Paenibacillus tritici]NQX46914.1 hypothetical protein [Paenibacillus tritici]QUL55231.1 hypothetical protein KDC22_01155 [Paenibacillus tritici]
MPNILESLYHGSLFPNEDTISKDPSYRPLNRQISESIEAWRQRLSPGEFEELESLLELYSQVQGMDMTAAFVSGFKAGTMMMIEVLVEE